MNVQSLGEMALITPNVASIAPSAHIRGLNGHSTRFMHLKGAQISPKLALIAPLLNDPG
jgi:hypothetical protein